MGKWEDLTLMHQGKPIPLKQQSKRDGQKTRNKTNTNFKEKETWKLGWEIKMNNQIQTSTDTLEKMMTKMYTSTTEHTTHIFC